MVTLIEFLIARIGVLRWLRVFRSAVPSTWAIPAEAPSISPCEKRIWPAKPHLEELGVSSTMYKTYTTGVPFPPNSLWLQSQCLQHQQIHSVCLRKSCVLNLLLPLSFLFISSTCFFPFINPWFFPLNFKHYTFKCVLAIYWLFWTTRKKRMKT